MKINVLMCCSDLSVKGGMVTVMKNYLEYRNWDEYNIVFVPTHIEKNRLIKVAYFTFAYIKIIKLAASGKIKLAHLHTAERGSFYRKAIIALTLKKFGVKVIMHFHAAEFEEFYEGISKKRKDFVDKILGMVDLNLVLSKRLIPMIKEKNKKANVAVLYNAVEIHSNCYDINANKIIFLGRLGERKGVYDLLKCIKRISPFLNKEIKFYLCGDGDVDNVKKMIDKLEIQERIAHVGWVDKEKKEQILRSAMINILPSYNEGLPMSILETMAYGIPNISTNIASIPEVLVEGYNGFLIKPGDVDKLGEYIIKLANDEQLRKEISINAWRTINENYSLDSNISTLKSYYSKLLGGTI